MRYLALTAAAIATTLCSTAAMAQAAQGDGTAVGTLIVAHGGGPEWNAGVEAVAREVRLPGPVAVSFLMGPGAATHRFQDAVRDLETRGARQIVVVPMLVSSHSGHYDQIAYLARRRDTLDSTMAHHLSMAGIARPDSSVPMRMASGMDDASQIAGILADRARSLATSPKSQALLLLGHGPNSAEDYAAWMGNLRRVADTVRAHTGFRSVLVELVRDDAEPPVRAEAVARMRELIGLQHDLTQMPVVVVPVLVAAGQISRQKLPRDLDGLPVVYSGEALLPHRGMARWVEAQVERGDTTAREPLGTR